MSSCKNASGSARISPTVVIVVADLDPRGLGKRMLSLLVAAEADTPVDGPVVISPHPTRKSMRASAEEDLNDGIDSIDGI
jgi:hypothetical protein